MPDMEAARRELREALLKVSDRLAVVEGARDRAALRALGFPQIATLERGVAETALHLAEERPDRVLILTDFDAEGGRLAARLSHLLERMKVRVDRATRRKLKQLSVRAELTDVEAFRALAD